MILIIMLSIAVVLFLCITAISKINKYFLKKKERKIIHNCIDYYEQVIKILPEEKWLDFLVNFNMQYGICRFLKNNAKVPYEQRQWVKQGDYCWIGLYWGFWYELPKNCATREKAIECLQYRIDKMKTLL